MATIRFLSLNEVFIIHAAVVRIHDGSEELRDRGLLESAVAIPKSQFAGEYLHSDLAAMAAAYLFHLNKNHAFVDGNKRVALASCETFLAMNEFLIDATNDELVEVTLQTADGRLSKEELTIYLRQHLKRASRDS